MQCKKRCLSVQFFFLEMVKEMNIYISCQLATYVLVWWCLKLTLQ